MNSQQYNGLKRLNIPTVKWGSNFRVKVRNQYGITTFISKVSAPKAIRMLSKAYKLTEKRIKRELEYEYRPERRYKKFQGKALEAHEFGGFSQDELYEKVKTFLESQTRAVKVNIQLGYKLIDRTNGLERDYYPSTNTAIWDKPIAINSKGDVEKKVISHMKATDFTERISYPVSAYQLKEINSANVVIYYRNHILGDSEIKHPDIISKNRFILNFPKTNNKCMFYCISYHLIEGEKPQRIASYAKQRVKEYCVFQNMEYSAKVYKEFKAIDIMQFDKLEDCFKLRINVFEMDQETLEINKIRDSEKSFDNVINILDYNGHAMYITDLDIVLSKFPCNVCGAVLETYNKLHDHKRTKCKFEYIESFSKNPRRYEPAENRLKSLLTKYKVDSIDHYMEHFIVYDFEAILFDLDEARGGSTTYTNRHQAVSVSICDSLTKQVKCFVNETSQGLLEDMFKYVLQVSGKIQLYN